MTNKGFGSLPPHEQRFQRLVNAMLEGYFDGRPMEELAEDIQVKHGVKAGSGLWKKAVGTIEDILNGKGYELLNEANRKHIFNMSIQIMTREGLIPGKDFSIVDGGLLVKNEVMEGFLESMNPEDRAKFEAEGYIKYTAQQDPFKMLEDQLGVPFFANLEELAKKRIGALSDVESASYLATIIDGMEEKHPWLREYWPRFIGVVAGDRHQSIVGSVDECARLNTSWAWEDILFALGKGSEMKMADGETLLSKGAIRALAQVWEGGGEMSLSVLADKLEAFSQGK